MGYVLAFDTANEAVVVGIGSVDARTYPMMFRLPSYERCHSSSENARARPGVRHATHKEDILLATHGAHALRRIRSSSPRFAQRRNRLAHRMGKRDADRKLDGVEQDERRDAGKERRGGTQVCNGHELHPSAQI